MLLLSWFAENYPRRHYEFFVDERIEGLVMLPFFACSFLGLWGSLWVACDTFNPRSLFRRFLLWLPFLTVLIVSTGFVIHYVFRT